MKTTLRMSKDKNKDLSLHIIMSELELQHFLLEVGEQNPGMFKVFIYKEVKSNEVQ